MFASYYLQLFSCRSDVKNQNSAHIQSAMDKLEERLQLAE